MLNVKLLHKYSGRLHRNEWWWMNLLYTRSAFCQIFNVLGHISNSVQEDIPHIIQTLGQQFSSLTPSCCLINGEGGIPNVFGLTQLVIGFSTFRTRGKHANHNTTKAVHNKWFAKILQLYIKNFIQKFNNYNLNIFIQIYFKCH